MRTKARFPLLRSLPAVELSPIRSPPSTSTPSPRPSSSCPCSRTRPQLHDPPGIDSRSADCAIHRPKRRASCPIWAGRPCPCPSQSPRSQVSDGVPNPDLLPQRDFITRPYTSRDALVACLSFHLRPPATLPPRPRFRLLVCIPSFSAFA
jgi:hypothetical protein